MVNLPNALTILRMCLIPVFVSLYYSQYQPLALVVFLLAGMADVLDGYLARKWNQVTDFGKLMDPLADKLMTLTMLFCMMDTGYLPMWVPLTLLAKEIIMVIAGATLLGRRKVIVMSNWLGKLATVLLVCAVALVFPWHTWTWMRKAGQVLMVVAVVCSLCAMVNYALVYVKKPSRGQDD